MAGKRKAPQLRFDGRYYVANIYKPDGKRTTISFGGLAERSEGQIYTAFGKWLDMFAQQPEKVLSYSNPYEAISQIVNPTSKVTIGELLEQYRITAQRTLTKMSETTRKHDLDFIDRVKKFLDPYLTWPVTQFGPDELYNIQQDLIKYEYKKGKHPKKYTRRGINDVVKLIKYIWKWGMGRQFVSPEKIQSLGEVKLLRLGTLGVPEKTKRTRVTEDEFRKVLTQLSPVVADMLRLIWLTAMRPYEVCEMRPFDILRDDPECWIYIPGRDCSPVGKHKTMRFERIKIIPLTKEPQNILAKYIHDFESKEAVFRPEEAIRIFLEQKAAKRKTPISMGNRPGTNRKEHPMITPGKTYDHNSLCRACVRACKRAGVEKFVPYDLRRTAATGTRSILGKEAAKVLLGHTNSETTDIYLLEEVQEAIKVAKLLGPQRAAV